MNISERKEAVLDAIKAAQSPVQSRTLMNSIASSRASLNRDLKSLAEAGLLQIQGKGRSTRYLAEVDSNEPPEVRRQWSSAATALLESISAPPATRPQVQYAPSLLTDYTPNLCSLLPPQLALHLFHGGYCGQAGPAHPKLGLAAKQPLEELVWSSACLDGISMSLDDSQAVPKRATHRKRSQQGRFGTAQSQGCHRLHQRQCVGQDITVESIVDVQALLMRDLVDAKLIGSIRTLPIYGCDYAPDHDPTVLQSLLKSIGDKARQVHNPIEAAFFVWVNLSYLQPFNFGNGCTARMAANIPLLHKHCAPLSFQGVARDDYELALTGIYQEQDVTAAVELFEFV